MNKSGFIYLAIGFIGSMLFMGLAYPKYVFFGIKEDSQGTSFIRANEITGQVAQCFHMGTGVESSEIEEKPSGYGGKWKTELKSREITFRCSPPDELTLKDERTVTKTIEKPL